MTQPVLSVRNLEVEFVTRRATLRAINGVSFDIAKGEVLGVVGESGAGKSVTGLAVIGLIDPPGRISGGQIELSGTRIDHLPPEEIRRIRGKRIGMIFQDPLTSLNPLYRIGDQIIETIRTHTNLSESAARRRAIDLLAEVGIPAPEKRIDGYPHEFSGGMRQRVVIALAICAEPELIIADEPTTALDVSVQAQIITLIKRLGRDHGTAVMLVTHDMGVIAETCDRVAVMYSGRIAEIGPGAGGGAQPAASLRQGLDGRDPDPRRRGQAPGADPGLDAAAVGNPTGLPVQSALCVCLRSLPRRTPRADPAGHPIRRLPSVRAGEGDGGMSGTLIEVKNLRRVFDVSKPWLNRVIEGGHLEFLKAVDGVSFDIKRGETFALVGESGSGKTTVARMVVGLLPPSSGEVVIDGVSMTDPRQAQARRRLRRRIQMVFQDPYASLNPRYRVAAIVAEPIRAFDLIEGERDIKARVGELLSLVGLHPDDGQKFPHEFSGGQRQRIAIARALASEAEFIVCDEPTSALDVSVQAQILNLMRDLQDKFGLTYLFISHNLAVVRHMATRIGVMYLGRIVEIAEGPKIVREPADALHQDAARRGSGPCDVRPPAHPGQG
ncbi:ABC-type glutathione transport system ATPase component [Bradyrhizobium sp. JR6.1]